MLEWQPFWNEPTSTNNDVSLEMRNDGVFLLHAFLTFLHNGRDSQRNFCLKHENKICPHHSVENIFKKMCTNFYDNRFETVRLIMSTVLKNVVLRKTKKKVKVLQFIIFLVDIIGDIIWGQ